MEIQITSTDANDNETVLGGVFGGVPEAQHQATSEPDRGGSDCSVVEIDLSLLPPGTTKIQVVVMP